MRTTRYKYQSKQLGTVKQTDSVAKC